MENDTYEQIAAATSMDKCEKLAVSSEAASREDDFIFLIETLTTAEKQELITFAVSLKAQPVESVDPDHLSVTHDII